MRQHLLAGEWIEGATSEAVIAPFSGEVIDEVAVASPLDVEMAIAAASDCATELASRPVYERVDVLRQVAAIIQLREAELATLISQEAAKPIDLARGEVVRAARTFAIAADELSTRRDEAIPLDLSPKTAHKWGVSSRFPVGPVTAITPFNFPLNLVAHKLAPAIAAARSRRIRPLFV